VEPFCGGLAVALGLAPTRAVLNDANPHLINFYRWVQRGLIAEGPQPHDEAEYYRMRARFNALVSNHEAESREAAELFYYLNRTGYNGLCRFNKRGLFNVPFGRYKTITYVRDFTPWQTAMTGWTFSCSDFAAVPIEPDDFVYADPPYDVEFTQYARGGFSWDDQVRTAEVFAGHPGPIVLVNQATRRIKSLYKDLGYQLQVRPAPRRISCNGDRKPAREVIATKNIERVK
jgi:DNA adenine methylase